jgi:serine protease AprX
MVKMILMYTAQPLAGFNTWEQGTGQLNVAGAVAIAKLVRSELLGLTPAVGSALLTQAAPGPQTTISAYAFPWAQGLVLNHATITGTNLINKYQKSYGKGYLLGDGVTEGTYSQSLSTSFWTSNLSLGNYLMKSDGTPLGGGGVFCPPASCSATAS